MEALKQAAIDQIVDGLGLSPEQAQSCLTKLMAEGIIVPFVGGEGAEALGFDWGRVFRTRASPS